MNLSQIKQDALKATAGPWKIRDGETADWGEIVGETSEKLVARVIARSSWDADYIDQCRADGIDPTIDTARHIANMDPPTTIALIDRLERLEKAAQNFIDKVDRGEARSVRSYAEFKAALGQDCEPSVEDRIRMKDERIAELEAKPAARQALGEDNEG